MDLKDVMSVIGPMDDAIQAVVGLSDGRWVVTFGEIDVELEHDPATDRLMFSTLLAPVPASRASEVLEALLLYNMVWRETGGVRMGLNGRGGPVVQMADIFAPDADARTVVTVARAMAERVRPWIDFLTGSERTADAAPALPSFATIIRG